MKKIITSVITLLFICNMNIAAKAEETYSPDTVYYTNAEGVNFTKSDYDKIINCFGTDAINNMDSDTVRELLSEEILTSGESTTIYVQLIETVDKYGKVTNTYQNVLDEDTGEQLANDYPIEVYSMSQEVTHTTSMKKITLYMYIGGSISYRQVLLTNEWISLPTIRSYDIIALRPGKASATVGLESVRGYQIWDGTTIDYNTTEDNYVYKSGLGQGTGGLAFSMNLKDNASTKIINKLKVTFLTGAESFTVYGTYQHATENVSLATSQKYKFSSSGMGGVLKFNSSSVAAKYDNTKGLSATVTY